MKRVFGGWDHLENDNHYNRVDSTSADALEGAADNTGWQSQDTDQVGRGMGSHNIQLDHGLGGGTGSRKYREDKHGQEQHRLATEQVTQFSNDDHEARIRQQIRRDDPAALAEIFEIIGDGYQRCAHDRYLEVDQEVSQVDPRCR